MTREIRHRWTNDVLWSGEAETVKDALHAAIASGAVLTGAVLTGADLTGADLTGAVLSGADLSGADLRRAVLTDAKEDLFKILNAAPNEVPGLLAAINEGRIDGSVYEGECACLIGTIANVRDAGCTYKTLGEGLEPDSSRPAETLFLAISPGHTPALNPVAKIVAEWVGEWLVNRP